MKRNSLGSPESLVGCMQSVVLLGGHGILHLFGQGGAVAVLERPHAFQVEEGDAVTVFST